MAGDVTERSYQALRLHQHRIAARLTCEALDEAAGWPKGRCFAVEYRGGGTVKAIKRAIGLFDPQNRRLKASPPSEVL